MNNFRIFDLLHNYNNYSIDELKKIRDIILKYEDSLKNNYPVMPSNLNSDKIIVISDCHYFSQYENRTLMDIVYNYAINNNIHHILYNNFEILQNFQLSFILLLNGYSVI